MSTLFTEHFLAIASAWSFKFSVPVFLEWLVAASKWMSPNLVSNIERVWVD